MSNSTNKKVLTQADLRRIQSALNCVPNYPINRGGYRDLYSLISDLGAYEVPPKIDHLGVEVSGGVVQAFHTSSKTADATELPRLLVVDYDTEASNPAQLTKLESGDVACVALESPVPQNEGLDLASLAALFDEADSPFHGPAPGCG